jgi:hypothetical protein
MRDGVETSTSRTRTAVIGHAIRTREGEIGHVEDALVVRAMIQKALRAGAAG